ncbi:hypothetical protein CBER1_11468 [Cercospora berteroae]|uniref:Uncharacterized protein n=1 Tax=Cercospora berteroae TaxID=357750 RepID=A0A2S6CE59_9PEZI|nr:hypothetical protein CBER1_11468 [Cercospora berteroae]
MEATMDPVQHSEDLLTCLFQVIALIVVLCMAGYMQFHYLDICMTAEAQESALVASQQETSDQRQEIEELRAALTARDQDDSDHKGKGSDQLHALRSAPAPPTPSRREKSTKNPRKMIAQLKSCILTRDERLRHQETRLQNQETKIADLQTRYDSIENLLTYAREQRVITHNQMSRELEICKHEYDFLEMNHRVALEEQAESFAQERREAAARLEAQNAEAEQRVGEVTAELQAQKAEAAKRSGEATAKLETQKAEAEQRDSRAYCEVRGTSGLHKAGA